MRRSRPGGATRTQLTVTGALRDSLISVIEVAYRFEGDDQTWLHGVLKALAPLVDSRGLMGGICDNSNLAEMQVGPVAALEVADGFGEFFLGTLAEVTPSYFAESFRVPCYTVSEISGWHELPFVKDGSLARWGVADALTINGFDASCRGPIVNVFLPRELRINPSARALLCRLGGHLATAYRLRSRLRDASPKADVPEAVLTTHGKVEYACGPARERAALAALRAAALDRERARGPLRRRAESAVELWRSMVLGRWTLVDEFEQGGKRYLLARENEMFVQGPRQLSAREQQVVALLVLGHSAKLIAYELGIAYSTVRVMVANAQRKLGATSREELCRALKQRQEE